MWLTQASCLSGEVRIMAMQKEKKLVHRRFPLIVRILLYIYVAIILFFLGLMIGFGILENPLEVFRLETWEHIINLTRE